MALHTVLSDPREFPRWRLLWPPAIPTAIVLFTWAGDLSGHQWNVHGDFIGVALLFVISSIVGTVVSAATLDSVLPALRRYPSLRTKPNLLCTAIAVGYLLVVAVGIVCICIIWLI